ncbi:hypothetical protein AJ79_01408 [Helicocarpus griseus UAMH5409]|uniref:Uncharacterized protein n=1 Tax=Helicocarpus griseus UAMH5409 TaxID=1447875 RepID=A0A2B7XYZ3_9EURO|nr:hypothetical protein AJ79_01408 [Helicocarpus griseus UAMH5409]
MANSISFPTAETMSALEQARNTEGDQIDPRIASILENAINEIWRRVQAQPETYILTHDEFSLFNYYRHRYPNPIAQRAVERYWNSCNGQTRRN